MLFPNTFCELSTLTHNQGRMWNRASLKGTLIRSTSLLHLSEEEGMQLLLFRQLTSYHALYRVQKYWAGLVDLNFGSRCQKNRSKPLNPSMKQLSLSQDALIQFSGHWMVWRVWKWWNNLIHNIGFMDKVWLKQIPLIISQTKATQYCIFS